MRYEKLSNILLSDDRIESGYVVFAVARGRFCMPLSQVREIIRLEKPRQLPGTLPYVMGVMLYEKEIVPVLDIRRRLGMNVLWRNQQEGIVLQLDDHSTPFIVVVDRIFGVTSLNRNWLKFPTERVWGISEAFIEKVVVPEGEGLILWLDYKKLFHF